MKFSRKIFAFICVLAVTVSFAYALVTPHTHSLSADNDLAVYFANLYTEESFGGIYYKDNTLVVNLVVSDMQNKNIIPVTSDDIEFEYNYVEYPIMLLEEVKDYLKPYMLDLGISLLDANEITNKVDIGLSNYNTDTISLIEGKVGECFGENNLLNFINFSDITIESTVAYELPNYENALYTEAKSLQYGPGTPIRINNGYYTLGPVKNSRTAYTAGHGFGFNNIQDVFAGPTFSNLIGSASSNVNNNRDIATITSHYSAEFWPASNTFKSPISGNSVYMWGAVSGKTSGTVSRTGLSLTINGQRFDNLAEANYKCAKGDSGAAIFASSYATCYGVQSSGSFNGDVWAGKSYFSMM